MITLTNRRGRPREDALAVVAGAASAAAAEVEVPPAVTPDVTAAAFFDVDNTMMMGASIYHFARGMAARKYVNSRDLLGFAMQQLKYRLSGAENVAGMVMARQAALTFVAGRDVNEIVGHCEEIYDEVMSRRIWSGTRALAQMHLDAGQRVWLVTATPVELANIIAHRLGLTGALGTVSEIVDGRYTGRLVGEPLHGPAKAEAVLSLCRRESLDLARCTAYSDSVNDIPMLSTVGTGVAINPDSGLRREARARGWQVHDYRTARKAAKVGAPAVAAAGLVAGGVAGTLAVRKRIA